MVAGWLAAVLGCGGEHPGGKGPDGTVAPAPTVPAPPPSTPTPVPTGTGVVVTVVGGDGGGEFAPGQLVPVWARVDPRREIVAGWTGDADGGLTTPGEWTSTFEVPTRDVALEPVILEVAGGFEERTIGARRALVSTADDPRGVVVFFHGASYSVDQVEEPAPHSVYLHLHHAGWNVVVATSAAEASAGTGGWSAAADLPYARALLDGLGELAPDGGPRVAWGMSSGGQFAHVVGRELDLDAVVAFCAPGTATDAAETTADTAWYLAERDQTFPTAAADATRFAASLAGRDVRFDLVVHPATPLHDARFLRAGLDLAGSRALVAAIRRESLVDATDRFVDTGGVAAAAVRGLPEAAGASPAVAKAIGAEVEILAADHELYDEVAGRMVAFLEGL